MNECFLESHEISRLQGKKIDLRDELMSWIDINFNKLNQYEKDIVLLSIFKNCFESQLTAVNKVYGVYFEGTDRDE